MILDKLVAATKARLARQKQQKPLEMVKREALTLPTDKNFPFEQALKQQDINFICEVKKASPSKGIIVENFPYLDIAREYEAAGASAISVLTEPDFFLGSDQYLQEIAQNVDIPVLCKDFTVDEYQIYEAKILGASAVLNIILAIIFVAVCGWGVAGSAIATVVSQGLCALGLALYTVLKCPELMPEKRHLKWDFAMLKNITNASVLTCTQQSVMNFGILMVQGLVNSFGPTVMAAFTVAVKIDTLAYMPAQDFGNAFSTFIGQNFGAKQYDRIKQGIRAAIKISFLFCLIISVGVFVFAEPLMTIFIDASETEIIHVGATYLRIEGSFYFGIGILFLLYGFYRAINFPLMSVILTVISLGTRVGLAYYLAAIPSVGVDGIWWSIPIGWILADIFGLVYYKCKKTKLLGQLNNV